MKNFTYYRPTTPEAAVGLLDDKWGATEMLAGGTDLLDLQKEYIAQPSKVVSIGGIGGDFTKILEYKDGGTTKIGGGVKLADIAAHEIMRSSFPALTTAAGMIGGPQIRNMGTLGGNLCQRNRCWYFRDEQVVCLLKGGKKCYATDGENRYHAVFTEGHPCVIVHPSTLAPALIALDAVATVLGPKETQTIRISSLFKAPKSEADREHILAPNQILLSVTIPGKTGVNTANASYEVRHKQAYDWPLVQAAVSFTPKDGKATNVKIVLGHVAPTPHIAEDAAKALEGQTVTEGTASEAGIAAAKGAKPLSQNAYKVKLIEVAVKRAILTAAGMKKYWEA
jgi:xanthine dehydrogenase YagS FAD-binding subunit